MEGEKGGGWASWAWSMVPAVLPASEESSDDDDPTAASQPAPPVFDVSFFNRKASLIIKVCWIAEDMNMRFKLFHT